MITLEETTVDSISLYETILELINNLFSNFFVSVDNSIYSALDTLTFINTDIFSDNLFTQLLSSNNGLLLIANALLLSFILYYCFKLLYSNFLSIDIESPYQFLFKLIIYGLIMNSSYFVCEQIVYLNYLISSTITSIGQDILNTEISFSSFITTINGLISTQNSQYEFFSFDGIIKSFITISLFNLLFTYSLRYIMLKVFILITPFAFLTLTNKSTSWFFKSWFKSFLALLILQSLVAIILLIIFSLNLDFNSVYSKLMCIGSIYALIKANSYLQTLIGGISTEVSNNVALMKGMLK